MGNNSFSCCMAALLDDFAKTSPRAQEVKASVDEFHAAIKAEREAKEARANVLPFTPRKKALDADLSNVMAA